MSHDESAPVRTVHRMPNFEAVVYVSSATGHLSQADLEALLTSARERNIEHAVTGVLLFHDGTFLQYFEGPPEGVAVVYDHIRRARQHHGIIELMHAGIEERAFPDWTMGFTHAPASELLRLSSAAWQSSLERVAGDEDKNDGLSLLLHFWRANRGHPGRVAPRETGADDKA